MRHRVVVTGLGAVTPIGLSVPDAWAALLRGASGVRNLLAMEQWGHLHPQLANMATHVAAPITQISHPSSLNDRLKRPRHIQFAEMAAEEALRDAAIRHENVGVFVGCGIAGVAETYDAALLLAAGKRPSPYFIPAVLGNSPAAAISRRFHLTGPMSAPSLACATGLGAIGDAFHHLSSPHGVDAIIAGSTEAPLSIPVFAGFSRIRALSTCNARPEDASRPFDQRRDGFVLGEGAGCLVLERLEAALARGAKIYAEIVGFGVASDAHHLTAPDPTGRGALRAINEALRHVEARRVCAVNAHATSTAIGDEIELRVLESALPGPAIVVSNKGALGHSLGAAGAVESVFAAMTVHERLVPGNINLCIPIPSSLALPTSPSVIESTDFCVLKTAFGFGGINTALCFQSFLPTGV